MLTVFAIDALTRIAVLHTTHIMMLYVELVVSEGRSLALVYDCWEGCFVFNFPSICVNSY